MSMVYGFRLWSIVEYSWIRTILLNLIHNRKCNQDDWFNVESLGSIMMLDLLESIWCCTIYVWNDIHVVKELREKQSGRRSLDRRMESMFCLLRVFEYFVSRKSHLYRMQLDYFIFNLGLSDKEWFPLLFNFCRYLLSNQWRRLWAIFRNSSQTKSIIQLMVWITTSTHNKNRWITYLNIKTTALMCYDGHPRIRSLLNLSGKCGVGIVVPFRTKLIKHFHIHVF